jgi:hypothetical protein
VEARRSLALTNIKVANKEGAMEQYKALKDSQPALAASLLQLIVNGGASRSGEKK